MATDGDQIRPMELVWPGAPFWRSYRDALQQGWSPNNLRPQVAQEELAAISTDPDAFFRELVDFDGGGGRVKLPDGSVVPRLPGYGSPDRVPGAFWTSPLVSP